VPIGQRVLLYIRRYAAAGGDAIYIGDACTTCGMISVAHHGRFSLPTVKQMVDEIHRLEHKAIVIYLGGVADRLEQIASLDADDLLIEASMKGYVKDVGEVVDALGDGVTLFGDIDPVGCLQDGSANDLEDENGRQVVAGRRGWTRASRRTVRTKRSPADVARAYAGGVRRAAH
jgi:uroporphyrinogen-III decarboxylase